MWPWIKIETVDYKNNMCNSQVMPLKREILSPPSISSPFSPLLRQRDHSMTVNSRGGEVTGPHHDFGEPWITMALWAPSSVKKKKKVLKLLFDNCIDIMANIIQAGFIFIYLLLLYLFIFSDSNEIKTFSWILKLSQA